MILGKAGNFSYLEVYLSPPNDKVIFKYFSNKVIYFKSVWLDIWSKLELKFLKNAQILTKQIDSWG